MDDEFKQLNAEITRIVENTTYAGNNLFKDATDGVLVKGVTFQIGSDGAEQMSVTLGAIDKTVTGDLLTSAAANTAIGAVDTFLAKVGTERSTLGANINRLGHTAANLASVTENTKAAAGRIMDADFAVESANMTRNQLLVQAGTTVLSSANQNTGLVMGLLR